MMAKGWSDLPSTLQHILSKVNDIAASDGQLKAFTISNAISKPATFGIIAAGTNDALRVTVENGKVVLSTGSLENTLFALSALPEQWEQFFKQTPVAPYQSYWGIYRMNTKRGGIGILGNYDSFSDWTHVWRRVLELLHDAYAGPTPADNHEESDGTAITGRYIVLNDIPVWGKAKIYYEEAGKGSVSIVFLHTYVVLNIFALLG